ncbi:MAG: hypothetical protein CM15mP120_08790 [Pseudomonadota bacterium]|nr:MAG: hypothetical protein CM15mP120_08790 [Pseudomonadota bacterium]
MQSVIEAHPLDEEMRIMRSQLEAAGTHMLFSAPWLPGENGASAYQPAIDSMRGRWVISQEPPNPVLPVLPGLILSSYLACAQRVRVGRSQRTPVP